MEATDNEKVGQAWSFFHKLGAPKFIAAPMVRGSDLPFRMLLRRNGFRLCYTPMIDCLPFVNSDETHRMTSFESLPSDRPLIAQFCTNNARDFVTAAKLIEDNVDAVDLNLGCPKKRAYRENFGAALMQNIEVICGILSAAVKELRIPVTAKIRIFKNDIKGTVEYARKLEQTGISLLVIHGRDPTNQSYDSPVDLNSIKLVKEELRIPVVANGGATTRDEAEAILDFTKCDAVMIARGLLSNPYMLQDLGINKALIALNASQEYLEICESLWVSLDSADLSLTEFRLDCVRSHICNFLRPFFDSDDVSGKDMIIMKSILLHKKMLSFEQFALYLLLFKQFLEDGMDSAFRKRIKALIKQTLH